MHTIHVELDDELVQKLSPHRNKLAELLELGLQAWQERERQKQLTLRGDLILALELSGRVQTPKRYNGPDPYVRHSPVSVRGKDVSDIVIEQRGNL